MTIYRLSAACFLLLVLSAHASAQSAAEGRALARAKCARCHAIGADGKSPFVAAPPLRDIAARYDTAILAESFAERMVTRHPAMPKLDFSSAEIDALLAYITSLKLPP